MTRSLRIAALTIIFLSVLSCNMMTTTAEEMLQTTTTSATESAPTEAALVSGRYSDQEGRFSLQLPDGWEILGPLEIEVDGETAYDLYLVGQDPAPGSGPGISRIVIAERARFSVEEFIESQCSTCPRHAMESVLLGTTIAERTFIGGGGMPILVEWDFIDRGQLWIGLSIHDPESMATLAEVLDTFQFE